MRMPRMKAGKTFHDATSNMCLSSSLGMSRQHAHGAGHGSLHGFIHKQARRQGRGSATISGQRLGKMACGVRSKRRATRTATASSDQVGCRSDTDSYCARKDTESRKRPVESCRGRAWHHSALGRRSGRRSTLTVATKKPKPNSLQGRGCVWGFQGSGIGVLADFGGLAAQPKHRCDCTHERDEASKQLEEWHCKLAKTRWGLLLLCSWPVMACHGPQGLGLGGLRFRQVSQQRAKRDYGR